MLNDLRVKLDRYAAKAAHCQRAAQEATDEPGRAFYEELADLSAVAQIVAQSANPPPAIKPRISSEVIHFTKIFVDTPKRHSAFATSGNGWQLFSGDR
jgi:hypothetical protein